MGVIKLPEDFLISFYHQVYCKLKVTALRQGCQKALATSDIAGYFLSFTGYDLLVKGENIWQKIVLLPPVSAVYFPRFSFYLKSFWQPCSDTYICKVCF